MDHSLILEALIQRAEQLHRRWFRQLRAIEGDPQWHPGWQRLEALRDLTTRGKRALESNNEVDAAIISELSAMLEEEKLNPDSPA
jgi:hypothetical protein